MSYLPTPSGNGNYRIKVLNQDKYVECIPSATQWLQLNPLNPSSDAQKWKLAAVAGKSGVYTITTVLNNAGLQYVKTNETYWGYGYPSPTANRSSFNWVIREYHEGGQSYSKITLDGDERSFYFDSNADSSYYPATGPRAVNFYYAKNNISDGPNQCFVFEEVPDKPVPTAALDVIFLQDVTGSQQPYIDKARDEVRDILLTLVKDSKVAENKLRANVIIFRDHPPQENSLLTASMGFTEDLSKISTYLAGQRALGGGDAPEAQSDALADALAADWNDDTTKVVILTTDAPPHGIGEDNDGFPDGCPLQNDPCAITDLFCDRGIILYVIACEPAMDSYRKTTQFYTGIARKTGGDLLPLGDVNHLANLIEGSLKESVDKQSLAITHKQNILAMGSDVDAAAQRLHAQFSKSKVQVETLSVGDYYEDSSEFQKQIGLWAQRGKKLAELKTVTSGISGPKIKKSFWSGGQPASSVKSQDITLEQVGRKSVKVFEPALNT
ncbi:hypothetical protein B0H16DRAFT_1294551 [Mycena metata]|uniref:VWFA domain-containing protein n=1 Tax=Mycena metata TaxID=1033252 RepID=A0AAD7P3F3_9AGAR|nr:hypothetical protein B0H16DRAFT_1294551 [Mycena metata]